MMKMMMTMMILGGLTMFENLKHKNPRKGKWHDSEPIGTGQARGFTKSPGVTEYSIKGNEGSRMVNCRICGFPCDIERDSRAKTGSWAGWGINQGTQLTAGTSIGDARTPAAGSVGQSPDRYYERDISAGCPSCGTLNYAD